MNSTNNPSPTDSDVDQAKDQPKPKRASAVDSILPLGIAVAIGMMVTGGTGSAAFGVAVGVIAFFVLGSRVGLLEIGPPSPSRVPPEQLAAPKVRRRQVDHTARHLNAVGVLFVFLGAIAGFIAFNMETGKEVKGLGITVNNIGLLHYQSIALGIAGFLILIGVLCILAAAIRPSPTKP